MYRGVKARGVLCISHIAYLFEKNNLFTIDKLISLFIIIVTIVIDAISITDQFYTIQEFCYLIK